MKTRNLEELNWLYRFHPPPALHPRPGWSAQFSHRHMNNLVIARIFCLIRFNFFLKLHAFLFVSWFIHSDALFFIHRHRFTYRLHFSASFVQHRTIFFTILLFFCVAVIFQCVCDCYDPITSRCGTHSTFFFLSSHESILYVWRIHSSKPSFARKHEAKANCLLPILMLTHLRCTKARAHIKAKQRNAINIYLSAVSQFVQLFAFELCVLVCARSNWKWIRVTHNKLHS